MLRFNESKLEPITQFSSFHAYTVLVHQTRYFVLCYATNNKYYRGIKLSTTLVFTSVNIATTILQD